MSIVNKSRSQPFDLSGAAGKAKGWLQGVGDSLWNAFRPMVPDALKPIADTVVEGIQEQKPFGDILGDVGNTVLDNAGNLGASVGDFFGGDTGADIGHAVGTAAGAVGDAIFRPDKYRPKKKKRKMR